MSFFHLRSALRHPLLAAHGLWLNQDSGLDLGATMPSVDKQEEWNQELSSSGSGVHEAEGAQIQSKAVENWLAVEGLKILQRRVGASTLSLGWENSTSNNAVMWSEIPLSRMSIFETDKP